MSNRGGLGKLVISVSSGSQPILYFEPRHLFEFSHISGYLDGEQIRVPDVLRLIALKLHAARDTNRRTCETDWQDVANLLRTTDQILKILNCERSFPSMADQLTLPNSGNDLVTFDGPEKLKLPAPSEPLREWTAQSIDPAVMGRNVSACRGNRFGVSAGRRTRYLAAGNRPYRADL